eukprot:COSAG04_NODE_1433_length_6791_cov_2.044082_9_plen_148_part_00
MYYERTSLAGGGELELRTYFHRTRRNLIVVEVELVRRHDIAAIWVAFFSRYQRYCCGQDCTACANASRVSLRSFSGHPSLSDVVFQQRGGGGADGPRELMGVLRAPENCEPSNRHLYDTNHTLGYVHDVCPTELGAAAGGKATVQVQ